MPTDISAPAVSYTALLPILLVLGAAVVGVLVEAFVPAARRRLVQLGVALAGLGGALVAVVLLAGEPGGLYVEGAIAVDGPVLFLQGTLCLLGIAGVLLLSENALDSSGGDIVSRAAARPVRATTSGWPRAPTSRPRSTRWLCSPSAACCCSRPATTCS